MMLALVVDDELFRLSLVVVDLLSWMVLLIEAFAAIWLLDEALSSVFVRRWRIYCMMLVDGFRGFVGFETYSSNLNVNKLYTLKQCLKVG